MIPCEREQAEEIAVCDELTRRMRELDTVGVVATRMANALRRRRMALRLRFGEGGSPEDRSCGVFLSGACGGPTGRGGVRQNRPDGQSAVRRQIEAENLATRGQPTHQHGSRRASLLNGEAREP